MLSLLVAVKFVLPNGDVLSQPRMVVGGSECQTFKHGIEGELPTIELEECALPDGQLRVAWKVREGGRVIEHEATGAFATGARFDAGIKDVIRVRVIVGKEVR